MSISILLGLFLTPVAGFIGSKVYDIIKSKSDATPPQVHVAIVGLYALVAPFALKFIPNFPQDFAGLDAHAIASAVVLLVTQLTHSTKPSK